MLASDNVDYQTLVRKKRINMNLLQGILEKLWINFVGIMVSEDKKNFLGV